MLQLPKMTQDNHLSVQLMMS